VNFVNVVNMYANVEDFQAEILLRGIYGLRDEGPRATCRKFIAGLSANLKALPQ
jgi:hypothetical protein